MYYRRDSDYVFNDYRKVLILKDDEKIFSIILKNFINEGSPNDDFEKLYNFLYDNFIVEFFVINNILYFKFIITIHDNIETKLFSINNISKHYFSYSKCENLILEYLEKNTVEDIFDTSKLILTINTIKSSLAFNENEHEFYELSKIEKLKLLHFLNEELYYVRENIEYRNKNSTLFYIRKESDIFHNNYIYDNLIIEYTKLNLIKRTVIFKFTYFKFSYEKEFSFKKSNPEYKIDALIFSIKSNQYDFANSYLREFILLLHSSNNDIKNPFNLLNEFLIRQSTDAVYKDSDYHRKLLITIFFILTFILIYIFNDSFIGVLAQFATAVLNFFIAIFLFLVVIPEMYNSYLENILLFRKFSSPEFNFDKKYKLFKNYMIAVIIIFCFLYIYSTLPYFKEFISLNEHY